MKPKTSDKPEAKIIHAIAKRKCWLNSDGTKFVEDGDKDAAALAASGAGIEVKPSVIERVDNAEEFFTIVRAVEE